MGIFKAISSAISGSMKDQWKEMFYCNAIPNDILLVRGHKVQTERSANNGDDNVITDGSIVCVADGEAALMVCNGRVTNVFTEPGEHTFRSSKTAGVFSGTDINTTASNIASDIGRRVSFGGDAPIFYRVYYMNTKEIMGNKILVPATPFRVTDENIGLDMDVTVSIDGVYSIKIVDPMVIYSRVIGNVEDKYYVGPLAQQLSIETSSKIQSTFATLSQQGLRVSGLPALNSVISEAVKASINPWLRENRGIEIASLPISGIKVSESDMSMITHSQRDKIFTDPAMAAAHLTAATADAMRDAAKTGLVHIEK